MKRKICVITGARADYGLLRPLLKEIRSDKCFELQLIATGMHLSAGFGLTYKDIKGDGFRINEKINISLVSDTPVGISRSLGLAIMKFAKAYQRLKPDIIVVLGDRFEVFAAASAAQISRIPVAHIHGGELTEGAFDNAFRHAITKMSHLHFVATELYRKRVIQLGESPLSVFNVGALGLDNIKGLKLLSKKDLEEKLNFKFNKHNLLVTFHPVTLEDNTSRYQFQNLLGALDLLDDTNIIFTKANADTFGRVINQMISRFVQRKPKEAVCFASMGVLLYLSAMQFVDAVVGNSSSGIIEAPSFKIGTVNIGDRQKGRIRIKSIIDCPPKKEKIKDAIKKACSEEFKRSLVGITNPYGDGNSAKKIKHILKNYNIGDIIKKQFYDIEF